MEAKINEKITLSYIYHAKTVKKERNLLPLPFIAQIPDRLIYIINNILLKRNKTQPIINIRIPSKLITVLHTKDTNELKHIEKSLLLKPELKGKSIFPNISIISIDLTIFSDYINNNSTEISIINLLKMVKHDLSTNDITIITEKYQAIISNKLPKPSTKELFLTLLNVFQQDRECIFLLLNWTNECHLNINSITEFNRQTTQSTILITSSEIKKSLEYVDFIIIQDKGKIINNDTMKSFIKEKTNNYFSKESLLIIEAGNITKALLYELRKERDISLIGYFLLNPLNEGKIIIQHDKENFKLTYILNICIKHDLQLSKIYIGHLSFSDLLKLNYFGGLVF